MVAVGVVLAAFTVTDAIAARHSHGAPAASGISVRITRCAADGASRQAEASGLVVNASPRPITGYAFSIAFVDVAADEQDAPVTVGALGPGRSQTFSARSASAFPAGRLTCTLANRNPPGDL